jgi:hypothetical protein
MQSPTKPAKEVMPSAARLPLFALLSHAFVAFTIECDNEFERQMPHRTSRHGATGNLRNAPWLVSMVMWSNCMQFVGEAGVSAGELETLAGTPTNLNGMVRWGYVVVEAPPANTNRKPRLSDWIIRATPAGRKAQAVWKPLFGVVTERWTRRFGESAINEVRDSLRAFVDRFEVTLPDCLPILGYGLFSKRPDAKAPVQGGKEAAISPDLPLPALLSKVLLAFAMEFERESELSLAICANVLRVLDEKGVAMRDLPRLTGASKEAIRVAMGILKKKGIVAVGSLEVGKGNKTKGIRLTATGRKAKEEYVQLATKIEKRWESHFGATVIGRLRESLTRLVGESAGPGSQLFAGIEPPAGGWRASVPKRQTLPHYPMVLHRGGFPDGS